MARKSLKREPTTVQGTSQDHPVSSGDTIVMDPDVTMTNGPVDEGHCMDQANERSGNTSSPILSATNGIQSLKDSSARTGHGLEVLGRGVKELVQKVQSLRHLGVEDLVLPLPKIVVVGDQSTGKSSLIEGMSEIKVPRSASTCTRCPLEINLSETPEQQWSCELFLHKKYVYQGNLGSARPPGRNTAKIEGATRNRPLGPWVEQDSEDLHFASLTNKDNVVDALERAQLAILNPGSSYEKYKPGNPLQQREHQVKFSPNVIRLDISGPGLPNLSFYDLPGVINVTDNTEEAYLVPLIRNLVKEYIKAENCINLLALTMTHDAVNSSAFGLIKEMKAEARTVGCLTKPDRMDPGEALDQWIRILRGEEYQLGFGYHVIKNNANPDIDHATARKEEAAFFGENEPWTTVLNMYSNRFGTLQLQIALSQQLTAQIRTSLPDIIEKVQQKADFIEATLKGLPEPLDGNLAAIVYGELLKFEGKVQKNIDGGLQDNTFQKRWHYLALEFRKVLADSRPVLMLPTPSTSRQSSRDTPSSEMTGTPTPGSGRGKIPVFSVDSDSEGDQKPSPVQPSGRKRSHPSTQSTPSKYSRVVPKRARGYSITSRRFSLSEVRDIIRDAYTGLPNQTHPKAIERMIKLSQEHWHEPVEYFLSQTRELCQTMVFEQVLEVFGHHQQTKYYEQILGICEAFFEEALVYQRQIAKDILGWELSKPNTLNSEAMNIARDKALALLQARRREVRANAYLDEQEAKSGKTTTGQARVDKLSKLTADDGKLPPDMYTQEIMAMSAVKGYYECAYNRFVDVLCASIHCGLFCKCRDDIVNLMKSRFGVTEAGATERLVILLAANPEQEHRRAQLKREMETIKKAQEHLEELTEEM